MWYITEENKLEKIFLYSRSKDHGNYVKPLLQSSSSSVKRNCCSACWHIFRTAGKVSWKKQDEEYMKFFIEILDYLGK